MTGGYNFVTGLQKRVPDKFDDLVRAASKDNVFALERHFLRDCLPQIKAASVRIKMTALEGGTHRLKRLWGRPKRVLVRREFDDLRWL